MIIGYFLPMTLGGVLGLAMGNETSKFIRYGLLIDPFYPFIESLVYLVMKYAIAQYGLGPEFLSYFVSTPLVACLILLFSGSIFFGLTVLIDTYQQSDFKTQDIRKPAWHPRYLDPDTDVLSEI